MLVAGQIAIAVVVLSAAALIGRSLIALETVDLSFAPSHLTVAELAFRAGTGDNDAAKQSALLEQLVSGVQRLPGIESVSPVVSVPYSTTRGWEGRPSTPEQSTDEAARDPMVDIEVVSPGFFTTIGLPVLRGRALAEADRKGAPLSVVLSESIARRFWPGEGPVGRRINGAGGLATVVGIVPDTRYRDLRDVHATMYYALAQSPFPFPPTTLVIRSARAVADIAGALRQTIEETTPGIALSSIEPFDQLREAPLAQPRMNAVLLGAFALTALVLAAVGLFGVLATMVRQRRRELGVRMALGASSSDVAKLVVGRGVVLGAVGAVVGIVAAGALNQLIASLLFGVTPTDAPTLGGVAVLVVLVAVLASAMPARATTRIAPRIALEAE